MILKVAEMANVDPSYAFAQEGKLFWKADKHYFCVPIEPHHSTAFETNP